MAYTFYITPEDYSRAEANGIKPSALEYRVRSAGWDIERATTEPTRKQRDFSEWWSIMEANGISKRLFRSRLWNGWTPERAATEPFTSTERRKELMKYAKAHQHRFPPELLEQAASLGISSNTFYSRVRRGWTPKEAATRPLITYIENGQNRVRWLRARGIAPGDYVFKMKAGARK